MPVATGSPCSQLATMMPPSSLRRHQLFIYGIISLPNFSCITKQPVHFATFKCHIYVIWNSHTLLGSKCRTKGELYIHTCTQYWYPFAQKLKDLDCICYGGVNQSVPFCSPPSTPLSGAHSIQKKKTISLTSANYTFLGKLIACKRRVKVKLH